VTCPLTNVGGDRERWVVTRGRCLKKYVPDSQPHSYFVITGIEVQGKAALAYRRRLRKKQR